MVATLYWFLCYRPNMLHYIVATIDNRHLGYMLQFKFAASMVAVLFWRLCYRPNMLHHMVATID
jgi:hypothetical protein